jgi:hypothetical protein
MLLFCTTGSEAHCYGMDTVGSFLAVNQKDSPPRRPYASMVCECNWHVTFWESVKTRFQPHHTPRTEGNAFNQPKYGVCVCVLKKNIFNSRTKLQHLPKIRCLHSPWISAHVGRQQTVIRRSDVFIGEYNRTAPTDWHVVIQWLISALSSNTALQSGLTIKSKLYHEHVTLCFIPRGKRAHGTQWIGSWMGPSTGLVAAVKRKKSLSLPRIEPRSSSP